MGRIANLIAGLSVLVLTRSPSGASQPLFRIDGQAQETLFGAAVAALGDIDGDGIPDFAVGAPQTLGPGGGYLDGQVLVYSGASKALLYELNPLRHRGFFGAKVAPAGDLDRDGVPDLIVGAPATSSDELYGVGSALAFSGATGELLLEFLGSEGGTYLGSAVAGVGDLDNDGVPEIIIGTPYGTGRGPYGGGVVTVQSGANGALL
ncbi:MAG TPA: integrin alpha, partial [Myxococcaceae bacterium]|nr:integrin alpha [Myxococcaceae bacterium]